MNELSIDSGTLGTLILQARALMAQEAAVMPDADGNPSDDERTAVLQESRENLTRAEIVAEIEGLREDQQAELVALMWIGRGDAEADEWRETTRLAASRREVSTSSYLLDHPLVAEHWADGLDKLGYGSVAEDLGEV